MEHLDAQALGGLRIVLHGAPPVSPLRALDDKGRKPRRRGKTKHEVEVGYLAARKLELQPVVGPDRDLDAERGADPIPVEEKQIAGLRDDDRRDSEIAPPQAEAGITQSDRNRRRHGAAPRPAPPR